MTVKEIESKAIETCPSELDMPTYAQGFVDGAKFGYNKANEWHYVNWKYFADKDYPGSESASYLVQLRNKDTLICEWETEEKKLKWTDLKVGDVITDGKMECLVVTIDKSPNALFRICVILDGETWLSLSNDGIKDWRKVEK